MLGLGQSIEHPDLRAGPLGSVAGVSVYVQVASQT